MGWLYRHDQIDDPVAYLTDRYNHDGAGFSEISEAVMRLEWCRDPVEELPSQFW